MPNIHLLQPYLSPTLPSGSPLICSRTTEVPGEAIRADPDQKLEGWIC
jgi:hypothetical protein